MSNFSSIKAAVVAASAALAGCVVAPPVAHRQPPTLAAAPAAMFFYPERGQDGARQERDRYECYRWAAGQSGFDPGMTLVSAPATTSQPASPRDGADVAAGAMTGAVVGAVASSRHHSAQGAVLGAIFGAALGAIAQESRAQATEQANATREQAGQAVRLDGFRRAMGACMLGRGYRVG